MSGIIPMDFSHVPQVAQMEKECFSDPWSEKSVASEIENPLSQWFVALERGKVVGYIGSQAVLELADVMNIAVAPHMRRQGLATALIEHLIENLKPRDVTALLLEVRASNIGAMALYETMGFVQVGVRKNYYSNPPEDGKILRKDWEL